MSVSSLWCHHTPGEFSRPTAAVGRGLPGCREAELMLNLAGMAKRLKWLRYCIAVLICSVQVEYTLRLRNSARLPYISYMLAAVVEHCLSGASYAKQSQISACMKFGNEACSVNGAYIHRKQEAKKQTFVTNNYSLSSRISLISSANSLYFPVTYP